MKISHLIFLAFIQVHPSHLFFIINIPQVVENVHTKLLYIITTVYTSFFTFCGVLGNFYNNRWIRKIFKKYFLKGIYKIDIVLI